MNKKQLRAKLGRPLTTDPDYKPHGFQHFQQEQQEERCVGGSWWEKLKLFGEALLDAFAFN